MFGGVHELSIDSKGRLAIPAKFRDLLARHYTPSLVVTVEARTHLVMYPEAEWQKTAENLQAMNVSGNPAARMFRDLMLNHAETLDCPTHSSPANFPPFSATPLPDTSPDAYAPPR